MIDRVQRSCFTRGHWSDSSLRILRGEVSSCISVMLGPMTSQPMTNQRAAGTKDVELSCSSLLSAEGLVEFFCGDEAEEEGGDAFREEVEAAFVTLRGEAVDGGEVDEAGAV